LLILALQVHNPFLNREKCKCSCGDDGYPVATRPPPTVHPRQATGRPSGISENELDGELASIKAAQSAQAAAMATQHNAPPAQAYSNAPPAQAYAPPAYSAPPPPAPPAYSAPAQAYGSGAPPMQTASAPIATKEQMGQLMMQVAPNGLGILLGVGRGDLALRLLRDWRTSPGLYLVDPYIHIWKGYDDPNNLSDKEHQLIYENLRNALADQGFEGRHLLVRDFSHSFASTFKQDTGPQQPPPSLVFVDANHAYDAVTRDLEAWWPLLPTGGLLAGSTFINDPSRNIGVRQAVEDFVRNRGVQILETSEPVPSWMVVKQ
jgi:hypothetical protein